MKKKIYLLTLIAILLLTTVACSKKSIESETKDNSLKETTEEETTIAKDDFESQAIAAILECEKVKETIELTRLNDVSVEITDKRIEGYTADVKCKVKYSNGYVELNDELRCVLEEWDDGWKVESVEYESVKSGVPIKLPDKVSFEKVDTFNGEEWVVTAEHVFVGEHNSNLVTIDGTYNIKEVVWNTSEITEDFTSGVVTIDIICEDSKDNGTLTGTLDFEGVSGKWLLTIDKKEGEILGRMERPILSYYGYGEILIWVEDAAVDITKEYAEKFINSNPNYVGYSVRVEPVSEYDAAWNILADIEYGADIYNFSQDMTPRLVSCGALCDITGTYYGQYVTKNNDAASVKASQVGDEIYAFPLTSDNGYFLYYDKSVVTDPTSLEAIVADCEKAGKKFCFEMSNGWYNPAFFFGTGCELTYDVDYDGSYIGCNIDYNSEKGLVALKEMISLADSPSFANTSAFDEENIGAIITGTWCQGSAEEMFGNNCGTCKLPEFKGCDGNIYQLSGFCGNKLWGVKPQYTEGKQIVCLNLAEYLSSAEVQLAYYEECGWGPSNLEAQQNYDVQADPYISALFEQNKYSVPQREYPTDYWDSSANLGLNVVDGVYSSYTADSVLMDALAEFEQNRKYSY